MSLIDKIFDAGIVGCGGAGFPTHAKLNTKVEYLIINAAECEPLLRTDRYIMCHFANQIIKACDTVAEQLGVKECYIALKSAYTQEIAALNTAILSNASKVKIHTMDSFYPAGDEQVIVYEVTGRIVPPSGIPLDVGCVVENITTMYTISQAMENKPFVKKYLSVTGEVNNPTVLCVPVGTSFKKCLELAGGCKLEDYYVISGGPMMGKPLSREEAENSFVGKTTSGYIILPRDSLLESKHTTPVEYTLKRARSACIQCTNCTESCPRNMLGHPIEPHKIMRKLAVDGSIESILNDEIAKSALLCCECGVCELFACPMQLQPRKINSLIKRELSKQGIRYNKTNEPIEADINREYRKIPTKRAAFRAGVGAYYNINITSCIDADVETVTISLKQGIGMASEPIVKIGDTVKKGQLIAKCPDNKLGSNLHASINGQIIEISDKITIKK